MAALNTPDGNSGGPATPLDRLSQPLADMEMNPERSVANTVANTVEKIAS